MSLSFTVALVGRCAASRQHRTSSDRRLPALHEQDHTWCTTGSSDQNRYGLRQCAEPLRATGIRDNEAAPPCEVLGSVLVNWAKVPPVGSGGSTTELSVTDGCRRPGGDQYADSPARPPGQYCSLLKIWRVTENQTIDGDRLSPRNSRTTKAVDLRISFRRKLAGSSRHGQHCVFNARNERAVN